MQNASAIQRKIDEVRLRFVTMLAARLDRFEQIRDTLETSDDPAALLDELRFGAHRIVGLAATLGFADLGTLAHMVETTTLRASETGAHDVPSPGLLDAIDDLLGEMALLVT